MGNEPEVRLNAMYFEVRFNGRVGEENLPLLSPGGYEISCGGASVRFDFYMSWVWRGMAPDTVRFEVSGLDLGSFPEAGAITEEMLMRSVFEEFYLHIDDAADASLQPVSIECLNFIFDGHSVMRASKELLKSAAKCISGESGHLESRKQLNVDFLYDDAGLEHIVLE